MSAELKGQAKTAAERELLTEAAWLKRLVIREIRTVHGLTSEERAPCGVGRVRNSSEKGSRSGVGGPPMLVRLRHDDRQLLDARAEARGMRPATYVSVLTRAHLRALAPLPKEEYLALKRSIGELAAIGRNINQIAKAANAGGKVPATVREEFRAMLKICEALRVNTKTLLKANETSWSTGHG
ncbi:MAG: MobC family plasmid mobilization relaxosome protein [Steroidobacteraceae bacterium]